MQYFCHVKLDGTGRYGTGRNATGRYGTGQDGTRRGRTGLNGTGRNATEQDRTQQDGTGREGKGRNGTGHDGTGRNGMGRDRTERDAKQRNRTGRDATRSNGTGQDGTRRDATGRDGTVRDGTGRESTGLDMTQQDWTGRDGTGQDATGQDGTGWDGTRRNATRRNGTEQDGTRRDITSVLVAFCHAQTCEDVNSAICQDMYAVNHDICSSACYSVVLCPRFCGKCPLKCYSCHEVDSPDLCNTTTQCPSADHLCIVTQGFNDDFKDVYKLGCASNSVCTAHFGPGLGRRDVSLSERSAPQGSCCSKDLCNVKSQNITSVGPPPRIMPNETVTSVPAATSGLCDDIDADICSRLETHFSSMCNIDCIANEVCPRKCGKCMGCYQCNHVTNPETCTQKTICGRGEQCFSVETISANFEQGFKLGCMDERLCSTFGHAAPGIFGKRQGFELSLHGGCCKGEFCNHHALLPTSTLPTTTSTTTLPTTTQTGCHTHYSRCPNGWLHHDSSCFGIAALAVNWDNATAVCETGCAELADFDSSSDLLSVAQHLGQHLSGHSTFGGVDVWVAGKLIHGVWQWTTTGHVTHSSLQHHYHLHNTYCGYITIVPYTGHTTLPSHGTLLHQYCNVAHLPLCEIKHVKN